MPRRRRCAGTARASAAQNYFRKSVHELNLAEMTLIAGLPAAPSTYSPFVHPEKARARQNYVLGRMVDFTGVRTEDLKQ